MDQDYFKDAIPWLMNMDEERFEEFLFYLADEEVSALKDACESEGLKVKLALCLVRLQETRAA